MHPSRHRTRRLPAAAPRSQALCRTLLPYADHNRLFKRRITHNGSIQIDKQHYYIRRALAGRYVVCRLDAQRRVFDVMLDNKPFKTVPIKGLYDEILDFDVYLDLILKEAESEARRLARHQQRRVS